jgi:ATP-dependent DNA helicase PIF1
MGSNNFTFSQEALDALESNEQVILITGKAGTGKTTLIKEILKDADAKQIVLAPTGVTALQVGGETIHKFFRIQPGLNNLEQIKAVSGRQAKIIEKLTRIIIDEISMVRADLLDIIDITLQKTKGNNLPFGGVQIIMVGDFYQLPPVITKDEKAIFERMYDGRFVFSSRVLQRIKLKHVELSKVFRQKDIEFINLLADIRRGINLYEALNTINKSCVKDHRGSRIPMLLTCRNLDANNYNLEKLKELSGDVMKYRGKIEGDFNLTQDNLPAPDVIELKPNARVMILKNDANNHYVNGDLGTVLGVSDNAVRIKLDRKEMICTIEAVTWERYVYNFNDQINQIDKTIVGQYTQLPIKLAWASTVHKAQGLTLDDVRIDFTKGCFESGQAYVALSRATSLDGLSLVKKLSMRDVIVDPILTKYLSKE